MEGRGVIVCAEIGINMNGSVKIAKQIIKAAKEAKADYCKFQKRDPSMKCEPHRDFTRMRETPWGRMTHLEYRRRFEFGVPEYDQIDAYCKELDIGWFASVWDLESLEFMMQYNPPFIKIPSALITDLKLVKAVAQSGIVPILSTGMSTMKEVSDAAATARDHMPVTQERYMLHCHAGYPAPTYELNLNMIPALARRFMTWNIGYSGHEMQLEPTVLAVALGAKMVERHITLSHSMWGSDQFASVEPYGFTQLVARIRAAEKAMGDGEKRVWESEKTALEKLRPPNIRSKE